MVFEDVREAHELRIRDVRFVVSGSQTFSQNLLPVFSENGLTSRVLSEHCGVVSVDGIGSYQIAVLRLGHREVLPVGKDRGCSVTISTTRAISC